jgi:serine carboxypeptidase-like clade 1
MCVNPWYSYTTICKEGLINTHIKFILTDQGVIAGNPLTDATTDINARVPYLHGMGIIPDELYEVT